MVHDVYKSFIIGPWSAPLLSLPSEIVLKLKAGQSALYKYLVLQHQKNSLVAYLYEFSIADLICNYCHMTEHMAFY